MAPLKKGATHKVIDTNIHELLRAGKPIKQAVAAALKSAQGKKR